MKDRHDDQGKEEIDQAVDYAFENFVDNGGVADRGAKETQPLVNCVAGLNEGKQRKFSAIVRAKEALQCLILGLPEISLLIKCEKPDNVIRQDRKIS